MVLQTLFSSTFSQLTQLVARESFIVNLYSSPNSISLISSRTMRWISHVERMGELGYLIQYTM
jgi:hypothetical protein